MGRSFTGHGRAIRIGITLIAAVCLVGWVLVGSVNLGHIGGTYSDEPASVDLGKVISDEYLEVVALATIFIAIPIAGAFALYYTQIRDALVSAVVGLLMLAPIAWTFIFGAYELLTLRTIADSIETSYPYFTVAPPIVAFEYFAAIIWYAVEVIREQNKLRKAHEDAERARHER